MKKVKLNLIGVDGNAFAILGKFSEQAKREMWSSEEIQTVISNATSSDYNHLLKTISSHCE